MLQQTQVVIVIPYFQRFTERFPTIEALAASPLDDVLKLWEGLGYYARARNLHRAAQKVVAEFGGRLPDTVGGLSQLPGIGAYTAGAIASIAFGQDAPVVDGNVKRVLCRVYALRGDTRQPKMQHKLWALAEANLPKGKAGRWNEALMELGATVCLPRSPQCDKCPLAGVCRARALGLQDKLPARAARKQTPHVDVTAAVIRTLRGGRMLIAQRPTGGMLGGLWEFPGGKVERGESLEEGLRREIREELGIEIEVGQPVAHVEHAYTHFRITLHAFECSCQSNPVKGVWRWVRLSDMVNFAMPVADRKIIAKMEIVS
jgi:A/G-specific adenine glycosylase